MVAGSASGRARPTTTPWESMFPWSSWASASPHKIILKKDADPNLRPLLMLARDPAYCESGWYNVYYRVWQLRLDRTEARLLLDGAEEAFVNSWVDGFVNPQEVLIEYPTRTTYTDFLVRPMIRHYVLRNGKLEREAPLALGPRNFADEWMRTDWATSSQWSAPGASASLLQRMHAEENFVGGGIHPDGPLRAASGALAGRLGLDAISTARPVWRRNTATFLCAGLLPTGSRWPVSAINRGPAAQR